MVRVIGFALVAPILGARIAVHNQEEASEHATMSRGLEVFSALKENPDDVSLQNEYRELVGEVEYTENKIFLQTGVQLEQEPVLLGSMSRTGGALVMAERTGFAESLGRILTHRRDYVFEEEEGNSKYVFDGSTLSLHSRMHVSIAGERNPRFVVRRAFNYLNPIATMFGQFLYRVIRCTDPHDGECSEGDILYTISKDRLGRGALWGMDEYRVYTGTGGCSRWGHGIVSCDQESQVLYSLGAGISEATFDTDFYKGGIVSINGDRVSGTISTSSRGNIGVAAVELEGMKIAHSTKVAGPPRWLNWVSSLSPVIGAPVELARALIWTDSYRVRFEGGGGPVDELLVSAMVGVQDLTRDMIAHRNVGSLANGAGSASAGAGAGAGGVAVTGAVEAGGVVVGGEAAVGVAAAR